MERIRELISRFTSRQLGIFAVLSVSMLGLIIAMIALSISISNQIATIEAVLGFNSTDVVRPFVQVQRETLKLLNQVNAGAENFDPDTFQLQVDLLLSRFHVLTSQSVQGAFTAETEVLINEVLTEWEKTEPLIAPWQNNPQDEAARQALLAGLTEVEFVTNSSEIRYQQQRGILLRDINNASERSLRIFVVVTLALLSLLAGLFVSFYRFNVQRRKTEEAMRVANAERQAAVETNMFKDQFLAVMSHELRTPLNAIIGFMGIISMSGTLNERNAYLMQRARFNADRLLALINDILDLSRIESGRFEIVPSKVSLRGLVEKWETTTGILAKEKELSLNITIDRQMPETLYIDEDAITKVATNLLSNAIKFTDKGSVALNILCQDSDRWILEVKDTGIGIPGHMHDVIFESFRQVDSSSTRVHGGTGLGLSIVQRLVKALGGTIQVISAPGEGSTFKVSLPFVKHNVIERVTP